MNNKKIYLIQQNIIKIYKQTKDLNTKLNLQCLQARFDTCENTKNLVLDIPHPEYEALGFTICDYIGLTVDLTDYLADLFNNYMENNENDILNTLDYILYKITDNTQNFMAKYENLEDLTLAVLTEVANLLNNIEQKTKNA